MPVPLVVPVHKRQNPVGIKGTHLLNLSGGLEEISIAC